MSQTVVSDAFILSCIKNRIREEVEQAITIELAEAQKRIEQKMRAMADNLALDLLRHYDVHRAGENITITVRKEI